jgi:hypothetical protein
MSSERSSNGLTKVPLCRTVLCEVVLAAPRHFPAKRNGISRYAQSAIRAMKAHWAKHWKQVAKGYRNPKDQRDIWHYR